MLIRLKDHVNKIKKHQLLALFIVLLMFVSTPDTLYADLKMRSYEYQQDFEKSDPFQHWYSNGTYTINSKGLSKNRASSGNRSFKLDVTFGTATYLYFKIPIRVPAVGQLIFTCDIYVEGSDGPKATLGTNVLLSPVNTSGIHTIEWINDSIPDWIRQSSDLIAAGSKVVKYHAEHSIANVTTGDVGIWIDKIGLFINAPSGGRIVLYVDNVQIKGEVPDDPTYKSLANKNWENYLARINADVNRLTECLMDNDRRSIGPRVANLLQSIESEASRAKNFTKNGGYPTPEEYDELKSQCQSIASLSQYASFRKDNPDKFLVTFPLQPEHIAMDSLKILPFTPPGFAEIGKKISIKACRGEYEAASFVIRAERPLSDIQLSVTDLIGVGGRKIAADAVDIKLVKCWYQAGDGTIRKTDERVLLPELLLNDDKLVKVDSDQQRNYLKVMIDDKEQYISNSLPTDKIPDSALIKDADIIQPFDLDSESNKQIWVTVRVPEDAVTGDYKGRIKIEEAGNSLVVMNLDLKVLPFSLKPPFLEYGIYYRGKLPATTKKGINSEFKSIDQYVAEISNIKDHGVLYPTLYQPKDKMLGVALSLRNQVGLPNDHLYSLGITTGNPTTAQELDALGQNVIAWRNFISNYGYGDLYVYGIDEATRDILISEKAAWKKVRDSGGKVFVACNNKAADIVGNLLDAAVLSGEYDLEEAAKFHSHGKKVLSYGNPQVGIEDFEVYRKNYGLKLACAGYEGAIDYAYQHDFGHIWNDFDDNNYRDHVFAYPTSNGVIDTIQWEGFREAVDDVRYLTTLIDLNKGEKEQVLTWLCPKIADQTKMHELRDLIIDEIHDKIKDKKIKLWIR